MIFFRRDGENVMVQFEIDNGVTLDVLVQAFRDFCLGLGYHPDTVTEELGDPP